MPTYEYVCTECAHRLEVVQSFTDASLTECPACTGRLRKVFSPVGVVFKGSGFYKTDSRASTGAPAKKDAGGGAATTSDSAKAESGTSESSGDSGGGKADVAGAKSKDSSSKGAPATPAGGSTAAAS